MTDQSSPIRPPRELRDQWRKEAPLYNERGVTFEDWFMGRAAQWGADQQLEQCVAWLDGYEREGWAAEQMRSDCRPKPPSLKQQALEALERQSIGSIPSLVSNNDCDTIRRALEALPND